MNRPSNVADTTRRLIDHARNTLTDPVMRTTPSSGSPGETDAQFQTLYDFIAEQEFDHVGVFTYSPEPGTKAVTLDSEPVPAAAAESAATPSWSSSRASPCAATSRWWLCCRC